MIAAMLAGVARDDSCSAVRDRQRHAPLGDLEPGFEHAITGVQPGDGHAEVQLTDRPDGDPVAADPVDQTLGAVDARR